MEAGLTRRCRRAQKARRLIAGVERAEAAGMRYIKRKSRTYFKRAACITMLFVMMIACEIDTTVQLDGNNPPTFKVSGSGGINFLRVVDLTDCNKSFLDCPVVWQIDPSGGQIRIADLPSIRYGEVPAGFRQSVPADGASPPALIEGKTYDVFTPTYNANGGGLRFVIKGGSSIEYR